jgi:outer membrane protein W
MKRFYLSVMLFVLVVGLSTVSWAEGNLPLQGSLGVGARIYGIFPKSDRFNGQRLDAEEDVGAEVFVSYRFLKYLALEVGAGYTEWDVKNTTFGFDWGTIEAIPIFGTLQLRWVSQKPEELKWLVPYFGIGGGYYILDVDEKSGFQNFWVTRGATSADLDIDDAPFFHVGGGIDVFLTEHIVLNIDGRYAWARTDIDETVTIGAVPRTLGDTISLNAGFVGAGFKFYF